MSTSEATWDEKIREWAEGRPDIAALVQIGSRVQGEADEWSDYDYHLITTRTRAYANGEFARELGDCWAIHSQGKGTVEGSGRLLKVKAVYDGALEVDFVILPRWQLVLATSILRWPSLERHCPASLRKGIYNLRIVAGSGWKVIKGGKKWTRRYARILPCPESVTETEFRTLCAHFSLEMIWTIKRIERGEYRAAQRQIHQALFDALYRLLDEEARMMGTPKARNFARRAEQWLASSRLQGTDIPTRPDSATLFKAVGDLEKIFSLVADGIAEAKNWRRPDPIGPQFWLDERLSKPR